MKSKKAASWIAYILATGLFVALTTGTIMWYTSYAETATKATVQYTEGKMDCRNIRIAQFDHDNEKTCLPGDTNIPTLIVENKGTLHVSKLIVQLATESKTIDDSLTGVTLPVLPVQGSFKVTDHLTITLKSSKSPVYIVPIVKVGDGYIGCSDKKLKLACKE